MTSLNILIHPSPFPFMGADFAYIFAVLELFRKMLEGSRRLIKTHSTGWTPQCISKYDTIRTPRKARMADGG